MLIQIHEVYKPWLQNFNEQRGWFDIMLSYRWGHYDQELVSAMYDKISLYSIGDQSRRPYVFLDLKRLKNGKDFEVWSVYLKFLTLCIVVIIASQIWVCF